MPTLNEGIREIGTLAYLKGWGRDPSTKIYYGMIEFAEAGDLWKHREDKKWLKEKGIDPNKVIDKIAEELIDVILYAMDCFNCIGFLDADSMFDYKMRKNALRNRIYADDQASTVKETQK